MQLSTLPILLDPATNAVPALSLNTLGLPPESPSAGIATVPVANGAAAGNFAAIFADVNQASGGPAAETTTAASPTAQQAAMPALQSFFTGSRATENIVDTACPESVWEPGIDEDAGETARGVTSVGAEKPAKKEAAATAQPADAKKKSESVDDTVAEAIIAMSSPVAGISTPERAVSRSETSTISNNPESGEKTVSYARPGPRADTGISGSSFKTSHENPSAGSATGDRRTATLPHAEQQEPRQASEGISLPANPGAAEKFSGSLSSTDFPAAPVSAKATPPRHALEAELPVADGKSVLESNDSSATPVDSPIFPSAGLAARFLRTDVTTLPRAEIPAARPSDVTSTPDARGVEPTAHASSEGARPSLAPAAPPSLPSAEAQEFTSTSFGGVARDADLRVQNDNTASANFQDVVTPEADEIPAVDRLSRAARGRESAAEASRRTPEVLAAAKFARASVQNFSAPPSRFESAIKKPLLAENKDVTTDDQLVGTGVAKPLATMPAVMSPHREMPGVASTHEAFAAAVGGTSGHGEFTPTIAAPAESARTAEHAVEAVLSLVERFSNTERHAVNLQFSIGGSDLHVRVELRADEVRTAFRTESPELRAALAHEWQAVTSSGERAIRFADPVFSSATTNHDSANGDAASDRHSQGRDSAARDGNSSGGTAHSHSGFGRAANASAPSEPAPVSAVAHDAWGTASRLHTFA
jgi:hypothetical protein